MDLQLTHNWFAANIPTWERLLPSLKPCRRILEIGCYEGAGTTWLIRRLGGEPDGELHCVDSWLDAFAGHGMDAAENRWRHNVNVALEGMATRPKVVVHKGLSDEMLSGMLARKMRNYFDLVYVDASHLATDALCDAVLAFRLVRNGGFLFFDD